MVTSQIQVHDCDSYDDRILFESELKRAGAEVTDHKINFRTHTVTFYIRLKMPDGHTLDSFREKLQRSPIWHLTSWANSPHLDPEDTVKIKR